MCRRKGRVVPEFEARENRTNTLCKGKSGVGGGGEGETNRGVWKIGGLVEGEEEKESRKTSSAERRAVKG